MGSSFCTVEPFINALPAPSVLNVPGGRWGDLIANSDMQGDNSIPSSASADLIVAIGHDGLSTFPNVNEIDAISGVPAVTAGNLGYSGSGVFQYEDGLAPNGGHSFLLNDTVVEFANTTTIAQEQVANFIATGMTAKGATIDDLGHGNGVLAKIFGFGYSVIQRAAHWIDSSTEGQQLPKRRRCSKRRPAGWTGCLQAGRNASGNVWES